MTGAERVAKRRAALRAHGLRARTFWLPDMSTAEFREQARETVAWLWTHQDEDALRFADARARDVAATLPPPWTDED